MNKIKETADDAIWIVARTATKTATHDATDDSIWINVRTSTEYVPHNATRILTDNAIWNGIRKVLKDE
jgi:hypothetical protein